MGAATLPYVLPRIADPELEAIKYSNLLVALLDRRERATSVAAQPFELTIDTSTVCHLRCPFCTVGLRQLERPRGLMRPTLHRKLLDELGRYVFVGWYFSTGEPLFNRQLPELFSTAQELEIYSVVSTNLSIRLSDERIDEILRSGLSALSCSIDGASAATYSRYRIGGNFDVVMDNLVRLVRRKAELGLETPLIEWRFLVFAHNAHEVEKARSLAAEIGVDVLEFYPGAASAPGSGAPVEMAASFDALPIVSGPAVQRAQARAPTTLDKVLQDPRRAPPRVGEPHYGEKCDWLYFGSTLYHDGAVGPCCLNNQARDDFGGIPPDGKFGDVWNNATYAEARSLWPSGGWERTKVVCARCPDSRAQDFQFGNTLQALLRNAPDWVLAVLSANPSAFFYDMDFHTCGAEIGAIGDAASQVMSAARDADQILQRIGRGTDGQRTQRIEQLRRILTESELGFEAAVSPVRAQDSAVERALSVIVCSSCGGALRSAPGGGQCSRCERTYATTGGVLNMTEGSSSAELKAAASSSLQRPFIAQSSDYLRVLRERAPRVWSQRKIIVQLAAGTAHGMVPLSGESDCDLLVVTDPSVGALQALAREDAQYGRADERVAFVAVDGKDPCLREGSVDLAYGYDILNHVEDGDVLLRRLRRCLRPDGAVVFIEPKRKAYLALYTTLMRAYERLHDDPRFGPIDSQRLLTFLSRYHAQLKIGTELDSRKDLASRRFLEPDALLAWIRATGFFWAARLAGPDLGACSTPVAAQVLGIGLSPDAARALMDDLAVQELALRDMLDPGCFSAADIYVCGNTPIDLQSSAVRPSTERGLAEELPPARRELRLFAHWWGEDDAAGFPSKLAGWAYSLVPLRKVVAWNDGAPRPPGYVVVPRPDVVSAYQHERRFPLENLLFSGFEIPWHGPRVSRVKFEVEFADGVVETHEVDVQTVTS